MLKREGKLETCEYILHALQSKILKSSASKSVMDTKALSCSCLLVV